MRFIGWEPCEATWWLMIRQTIAKPWPREAVLMDLRFWRGQELATTDRPEADRIERPGRPALSELWGWTDWNARSVMKSEEEWGDPMKSSSTPPARIQRPSSTPPVTARLNADKIEESSNAPPTPLQRPSSTPPRARSILTDSPIHLSPITVPPPTPSFDSTTVDVPAVNEEEEGNSFQQNPEDSRTQQPKSMIEPEQTMDPTNYDHDKDVSNEVAAALEEDKIRRLSMTGIAGVDPKDIPVGYFARHIEDPEYTKSLWKDIADRAPKEKVRDIVPLDQLPPDPELDALFADQWKSPDTTGIPCLLNQKQTGTPPDDEPPKGTLPRLAPLGRPAATPFRPKPIAPPVGPSGTLADSPIRLFAPAPKDAPARPVAPATVEILPTTMLPPEVTDFGVLLATRPDGEQGHPMAIVQGWVRSLLGAGITTPQQLENMTFDELKFTKGIGGNVATNVAKAMVAWGSSLAPDPRARIQELRKLAARHSSMPSELTARDRRWLKAAQMTWADIRQMTDYDVNGFAKRLESAKSAA